MKRIYRFIPLLLLAAILISCNDSSEGLIQHAMSAEYQESFRILSVVGRSADSSKLYVATEKGIYTLNSHPTGSSNANFTYVKLDGEEAKSVLYYTDSYYLIQESDSIKLYTKGADGNYTSSEFSTLSGYTLPDSSAIYSPDGINFTYVFLKDSGYYRAKATISAGAEPTITVDSTALKALSIVGLDTFREITYNSSTKKYRYAYYTYDSTTPLLEDTTTYLFGLYNNIGVDDGADIYYSFKKVYTTSITPKYSIMPIAQDGLVIIPGARYYYTNISSSGATRTSATSNLSSVGPSTITKSSDSSNLYLVITAKSGGYILDTSSNKLTSLKDYKLSSFAEFTYK